MKPAAVILSRLSALGARIERRGERLVLHAGPQPVPRVLVEMARTVKPELLRLLADGDPPKMFTGAPNVLSCGDGERLRAKTVPSAAEIQASRLRCSPDGEVSTLGGAMSPLTADVDAKMLTGGQREHLSGNPSISAVETGSARLRCSLPAELSTLGPAEPTDGRGVAQPAREPSPHTPAASSSLDGEPLTSAWGEAEEERAAIVEYDGNIPRTWAEGFARLDRTSPPADLPFIRWRRFVDDVGLFLDSPFCAVAAALGWGPYDLFGCDRDRPFARIDQAGLLWLLNGDRLVMLAKDAATIESRTGARQTWRRKPAAPGRVLAWELMA